jgi:hypothetical protein
MASCRVQSVLALEIEVCAVDDRSGGACLVRILFPARDIEMVCDEHGDVASANLLENWIDEAERRTWFAFEARRRGESPR